MENWISWHASSLNRDFFHLYNVMLCFRWVYDPFQANLNCALIPQETFLVLDTCVIPWFPATINMARLSVQVKQGA